MKHIHGHSRVAGVGGPALAFVTLGLSVAAFSACRLGGDDRETTSTPDFTTLETGDGVVTASWTAVPGAVDYDLYWATEPNAVPGVAAGATDIDGLSWTVTGLDNGGTYYFTVRCQLPSGAVRTSVPREVTLPPGAVENLTIVSGDSMVTLSWDAVWGATTYELFRSTDPMLMPENGEPIGEVTSPFVDLDVVNGTAYYYVLRAVGKGGASELSAVVSAEPLVPLGAPENPAVSLIEEVTNTLSVSWDPPSVGVPDTYNIYWDTEPNVPVGTNPIEGVTSPYLHTGLPGRVTHYYVVTAVTGGFESLPSAEVSGAPRGSPLTGGGGGGGGGGEEGFGNNLSLPVVFAEGYGMGGLDIDGTVLPHLDHATGLRPTADDVLDPFPYFDPGTTYPLNGIDFYPQQSASTWQADWVDGSGHPAFEVVADWGDNLESQQFRTGSVVRVETILYIDDPLATLAGYEMALLHGSKRTEMQGTSTTVVDLERRHVYTVTARLRIEKLLGPGGALDPSIDGVDLAVYERFGAEESGGYGAEVNVGGKLVFGYVWMLKQSGLTEAEQVGWWRLTFSLDPVATYGEPAIQVDRNVRILAMDASDESAVLDPDGYATSIEIEIAAK